VPSASWQIWPQGVPTNFAVVWQCKLWQNLEVYEGTYYGLLWNLMRYYNFLAVMIIMSSFLGIATITFSFCLTDHFCWVFPCLFGSCQSTTFYQPYIITFTQVTAPMHWRTFCLAWKMYFWLLLQRAVETVCSHKFLPLIYQLAARMSRSNGAFQAVLRQVCLFLFCYLSHTKER